jgi:hypothetical protein
MRRMLVGGEVAVSMALVLMTGLLTLSLMRMMRLDRGFDSTRTIAAQIALPRGSYGKTEQRQSLYERVTASLRQLPGVERVGFINLLPLERNCETGRRKESAAECIRDRLQKGLV